MFTVGYAVYLFVLCIVLALLEIQIEGQNGWASALPCWRPKPESRIAAWYSRVMDGKPLTGYHIAIFSLVLIVLHQPFFTGVRWSIVKELEVLSAYFLVAVCWDFLWFVFNPAYGLKRFKPEFIGWHRDWVGPLPVAYISGFSLSLLLFAIAVLIILSGGSLRQQSCRF